MRDNVPPFGQVGTIERDPLEDRLRCHVCGRWCRNLAQHARLAHELAAAEYRATFGLNRQTRLVSDGMRERLREAAAPVIARLRAEGRLRNWGEDRERFQRDKAAAVEAIRQGMRPEASARRREAFADERIRTARAERRRARNLAGLDRATPAAIRAGLQRAAGTSACQGCGDTFQKATPTHRFCAACQSARARETTRLSAQRRRLRAALGEEAAPRRTDPLSP
ncbi:MAG: MucR family transcriptional regulator [Burkholderiales bacterium]|nr:MucR family transcriptional regulator [Burkholderiales bacterium]